MSYAVVVRCSVNRIHRYYIFRIIILYFQEVAEFPFYGLIVGNEICNLKIYGLAILFGYKINFAVWKQPHRKLVSETFQV